MLGEKGLAFSRTLFLILFLLSLLGAAFAYGQQTTEKIAKEQIEKISSQSIPVVKSYTKAVCSDEGSVRHCKDLLFIFYNGREYQVIESEVSGSAQFLK